MGWIGGHTDNGKASKAKDKAGKFDGRVQPEIASALRPLYPLRPKLSCFVSKPPVSETGQ